MSALTLFHKSPTFHVGYPIHNLDLIDGSAGIIGVIV